MTSKLIKLPFFFSLDIFTFCLFVCQDPVYILRRVDAAWESVHINYPSVHGSSFLDFQMEVVDFLRVGFYIETAFNINARMSTPTVKTKAT